MSAYAWMYLYKEFEENLEVHQIPVIIRKFLMYFKTLYEKKEFGKKWGSFYFFSFTENGRLIYPLLTLHAG